MKTKQTNFEAALIHKAQLLSLQKSDCDLFLIAQANTITYKQLHLTGLHGKTITAGRLSLKRNEEYGFIQSKTIPLKKSSKYYTLTAKGRSRLIKLVGQNILEQMNIDLSKRPPAGTQQLSHRINANDFYYSYVGSSDSGLITWEIEKGFDSSLNINNEQLPRCDGCLQTVNDHYYIEQDNCTQSAAVLSNKIKRYLASELFNQSNVIHSRLIFTVQSQIKNSPSTKPFYSLYRTMLKVTKYWKILEENSTPLSFDLFIEQAYSSEGRLFLSSADIILLKNIKHKYKNIDSLDAAEQMKNYFLNDKSYEIAMQQELDLLFFKRLEIFRKLIRNMPDFRHALLTGMDFYVIPNHRINNHTPFIFIKENKMYEKFLQVLFYAGLNIDNWSFRYKYTIRGMSFKNVFVNTIAYIVFEDISSNLGAYARIKYFLSQELKHPMLFILMVDNTETCASFEAELDTTYSPYAFISYVIKSKLLIHDNEPVAFQFSEGKTKSVLFDYDNFSNTFSLIGGPLYEIE